MCTWSGNGLAGELRKLSLQSDSCRSCGQAHGKLLGLLTRRNGTVQSRPVYELVIKSARVLRDGNSLGRWSSLATLARLRAKAAFGLHGDAEHVYGHVLGFANYAGLVELFEQVFLSDDYCFDSASSSPYIIDCGANVGMATAYFLSRYPQARILAIEAAPDSFAILEKNRIYNQWNGVECLNLALAAEDGVLPFYSGTQASTMASLIPKANAKVFEVKARRLSSLITRRVDFLKVDIEGAEVAVLEDLVHSRAIDFVQKGVFEYHHHRTKRANELGHFLSLLETAGFGYHISSPWCGKFDVPERPQPMMIGIYRT